MLCSQWLLAIIQGFLNGLIPSEKCRVQQNTAKKETVL